MTVIEFQMEMWSSLYGLSKIYVGISTCGGEKYSRTDFRYGCRVGMKCEIYGDLSQSAVE